MAKVVVYLHCCALALLLLAPEMAGAQYKLHTGAADKSASFLTDSLRIQANFKSELLCRQYVLELPAVLQQKGYLSASVDSSHFDSTGAFALLYIGEKYAWQKLETDSVEPALLAAINWNPREYSNRPVRWDQLNELQQRLLDHLENSGHPFARVFIDSVLLQPPLLTARLRVDPGPAYKIDSVRNLGTANISPRYLQRLLNILPGSPYRKASLLAISRRISELPFVEEQTPWTITWLGTGSVVNLNLVPRKSSQVNVLVGLLPAVQASNNIYEAPRTKLQFTGEATINLRNALGNGELIGLNWQQIQVKSPRLNLAYQQSYLFGSPFGVNLGFDLFKKDSSFLTVNGLLGIQYAVSSSQSGALFVQTQQSNLIRVDTNLVKQTRQLPLEADIQSVSLGIQYEGFATNYRFNPTRGNEWQFQLSAGSKKVKKNSVIVELYDKNDPAFDFNSLYDTLKLKSFQFRFKASGAHYFPIGKAATLKTALSIGWFQSPYIFRNELFQLGGYKLLRGFDEESIYASQFAVATVEYRYLVGRNSFLFAFTDGGWSGNKAANTTLSNSYIGAGLGMALETKAGIFNISFAAGKRNDLPFNLRQSKIHLGYVNFF